MVRTLDRAVPGLSKHIVFSELGTPVTSRHFLNATEALLRDESRSQMEPFSFRNGTEIKNLFLCGASTSAHGVSGAAYSGLDAAAAALGCKRKDILKNQTQRMRTTLTDAPDTWPEGFAPRRAARARGQTCTHPRASAPRYRRRPGP